MGGALKVGGDPLAPCCSSGASCLAHFTRTGIWVLLSCWHRGGGGLGSMDFVCFSARNYRHGFTCNCLANRPAARLRPGLRCAVLCRKVGVKNIREYEEKHLKEQQEHMEEKRKLATQVGGWLIFWVQYRQGEGVLATQVSGQAQWGAGGGSHAGRGVGCWIMQVGGRAQEGAGEVGLVQAGVSAGHTGAWKEDGEEGGLQGCSSGQWQQQNF